MPPRTPPRAAAPPSWTALRGPALRVFFRVASRWGLTDQEQMALLGLNGLETLRRWRRCGNSRLRRDTLERISYVLGIYRPLQILLPIAERADGWVHAPMVRHCSMACPRSRG